MELILAMDLKAGEVVHGASGNRDSYRPLTWGLSSTADPVGYLAQLSPRHLYVADLDRIMGNGDHMNQVIACSSRVETCYLDRGCRGPWDYLRQPRITDIAATETSDADLSTYPDGYLSVDVRSGRVMPSGEDPRLLLRKAGDWHFEGAIILNVGAVGTESGIIFRFLAGLRAAYDRPLLYGGGVASPADLDTLAALGFDGAIIATAIHRGTIPLENLRRGRWS
ncbi:MAG: 1-(5-phosphoribosyl)-5-((5-phosphoribosylamino)methylideneamino) imidazole-4-carboxamide isomerase [Methanoregulaceae archaeon PtaB.Bin152]|nr:MAG: 1-(5-phosphoribosyl)-5-((5-phosphoribosylamino)methylideneamino) imidazole-4-carboxamide isomerase [Methanoregulaceae archaeon PtaB.Bin152]